VDVSQLDLSRQAGMLSEGLPAGTDTSSMIVGTLVGLDIAAGQVQVTVADSEPVWIPAAPFIYAPGAKVRLRRSPLNGSRLEFCEGPLVPESMVATGTVLEVTDDALTVRVLDDTYELPFASSTYDVDDKVLVLRHPSGFGVPQAVMGIAGLDRPATNPGGGAGNPGQAQQRQAIISPQDSGSFKTAQSRWDSWNLNTHGGAPSLWQGNAYGSGPMIGWAGYGDQVANLWASSIDRMWVDVIRADSSVSAARTAVLQGSPDGVRPAGTPGGVGDGVATGGLAPSQSARVELPASSYEAWRTGGIKGLRTVGGDYLALAGTNRGGAMVLVVQYTVVA
jgi:hypothetical protein